MKEKVSDFLSIENNEQARDLLSASGKLTLWQSLYETDWVLRETMKAVLWCKCNSKKAPRSSWSRFLNSWFERGWERYRKSLPTVSTPSQPRSSTKSYNCNFCHGDGALVAYDRNSMTQKLFSCRCKNGLPNLQVWDDIYSVTYTLNPLEGENA